MADSDDETIKVGVAIVFIFVIAFFRCLCAQEKEEEKEERRRAARERRANRNESSDYTTVSDQVIPAPKQGKALLASPPAAFPPPIVEIDARASPNYAGCEYPVSPAETNVHQQPKPVKAYEAKAFYEP